MIVALVGGMVLYGKSGAAGQASKGTPTARTRETGFARTGAGGGFVSGQIISVRREQYTVSLANGNSQVVFYSSSTQVMKPTIVPASALVAGTRVMIGGAANSVAV